MSAKLHRIIAKDPDSDKLEEFYFNPSTTSILVPTNGQLMTMKPNESLMSFYDVPEFVKKYSVDNIVFSDDAPGKKDLSIASDVMVKLGETCNYGCTYCAQGDKSVAEKKKSPEEFQEFIDKFVPIFLETPETTILNLYGGEPFVYFKEAKKLVAAVKAKRPNLRVQVTTNGSVLTPEIVSWCKENLYSLIISHDGPGQKVRNSTDYMDDPEHLAKIRDLVYHFIDTPGKIFMISPVLTRLSNFSRLAVNEYMEKKLGFVPSSGAGHVSNFYGNMTEELLFDDTDEGQDYLKRNYEEIKTQQLFNFSMVRRKLSSLIAACYLGSDPSKALQTRCLFDTPKRIPIDTDGNVLTCGNISAKDISQNGHPHLVGSFYDLQNVELRAGRHPTTDVNCVECPAAFACNGGCFYITEPETKHVDCLMMYYDYMGIFAMFFYMMTGKDIVYYDNPSFPEYKKDLFGNFRGRYKKYALRKKQINLKVI